MSDYMFMLESHLSGPQNRVLAQVVAAAQETGASLFLSGGSVRDMMGGFAVRDLDFVMEGPPAKLAKILLKQGAEIVSTDDVRKTIELEFTGSVQAGLSMSRSEKYMKSGGKPQVAPAPIHEHLRNRDFTINAIALSINRASRGLLIDPTNGVSDLAARELRAVSNSSMYDDPSRLLRLLRLKARLGFAISERTASQYANVREAGLEKLIPAPVLRHELLRVAYEPDPGAVLNLFEEERLLTLFSPALTGAKINHAGFQKLQKAMQMIPYGMDLPLEPVGLFFILLTEKLPAKERAALVKTLGLQTRELDRGKKLEPRAKKLEKALMSNRLNRASQVYATLKQAPGDEILYLLCLSQHRLVADRLKNFLQKYVVTAQEVTEAEVVARGGVPGTPKFLQVRENLISGLLDGRIRRPAPPPVPDPPPVAATARRFN